MKLFAVLLLFTASMTVSSSGITLEDVAGTYEGWRTQTIGGQTTRWAEVDTIYADGTIVQEVTGQDGFLYTQVSVLEIDERGQFYDESGEGELTLRGAHLDVHVHWSTTVLGEPADVHFSANRIPRLNPSRSKPNLTLEQMAGVYQGWRTQTLGGETIRYPEVATIFADGTLIEEVTLPDGSTYTNTSSQWNFDQTGRFGDYFTRGVVRLQGNHLDVHVHFVETGFSPSGDVHFSGNRIPTPSR